MSNEFDPESDAGQPTIHQIRIRGHLGRGWAEWFGGVTITLEEGGETLLTCPVVDQAALYGLLRKVRDLGLPLISVTRIKSGDAGGSDTKPQIAPGYSETDRQDDLD